MIMESRNFFVKLMDFSFKDFITLQIVKYLYILGILGSCIYHLRNIMQNFDNGLMPVLTVLFTSAITLFFSILFMRLVLEGIVAIFRIAENTTRQVEYQRQKNT